MKVVAFIMVVCIVFLSAMPGKANIVLPVVKENCCHKTPKQQPCSPKQSNDCGQGLCNTMLSCASCGFLKVDPIRVNPGFPVIWEPKVTPYDMGALPDYSIIKWNPPKV